MTNALTEQAEEFLQPYFFEGPWDFETINDGNDFDLTTPDPRGAIDEFTRQVLRHERCVECGIRITVGWLCDDHSDLPTALAEQRMRDLERSLQVA